MPATYTTDVLGSRALRRIVEIDIDAALNIVDLGTPQGAGNKCFPIANFRRFIAGVFRSVSAPSALTAFQIIAATDAAGTGATIVVAHALGAAPDAVGDTVFLECDVEQVREVLAAATHVGVRVQVANAADENVIYFEANDPMFPRAGLTADFVS
jgi:hypothetical protein